jgi:hypothetical protein
MAAVWLDPRPAVVQERIPITIGSDLLTIVPSPSCPTALLPQRYKRPAEVIAAVWLNPENTAVQDINPNVVPTCTGLDLVTVE